ncbi:hypothetical protein [Streptomyces sp. NPDC053720]|uniref:hypothetical protein n=1 Tax=Streptomyces sp. NPDC053720 TaxID=3154855 RepID=UPI003422324F
MSGQRRRYLAAVDAASLNTTGQPVSQNLGAYLLMTTPWSAAESFLASLTR